MTPHHALSAVDRLFRDLMGLDVPFGGKKNSPLWSSFKQFSLIRNIRTEPREQDFASWLLHLGNGTLKNDYQLAEDIVEIPEECVNEDSLKINEPVLKRFPGQNATYFSADSIISEDQEQYNFKLDFINGITPSRMPPHVLNLKVGAVIMLLRNLNPSAGLCNGTHLIIRKLLPNVIDAEILIGHTKGSHAFIPRITLRPSDSNLPFQLQKQFPV
ncbi:ATP-dependent DNA helicase [Trichonephila clavipes]|nr:ATP-dependent DNA helicase [Trichonephila clavipes]